jgi:hypothetical protein
MGSILEVGSGFPHRFDEGVLAQGILWKQNGENTCIVAIVVAVEY